MFSGFAESRKNKRKTAPKKEESSDSDSDFDDLPGPSSRVSFISFISGSPANHVTKIKLFTVTEEDEEG